MFLMRFCLFCLFAISAVAPAAALDRPTGPTILTVDGLINVFNYAGEARFDRAMLAALDWQEVETYTDYTEGVQHLAGPSLSSLLEVLGVTSGNLRGVALDDYVIDIPVADAAEFDVILALEWGGKPMRVRHKGPIWIVYPAPTPEDIDELLSSRMIWQLTRITVRP